VTGAVSVAMACTAVADDNGMGALSDVATVAADIQYRVIGGHMVRLLRHVYNVPGIPRVTSDADTGIDVNVASTGGLHDRGEQAGDLLVPTAAKPGKRIIGERAFRRGARAARGAGAAADPGGGHRAAHRRRHD
jgi:hypothetical protein